MPPTLKVSIVIPCYNEHETVEAVLAQVRQSPIAYPKEIIIVDDCSTDGTRQVLSRLNFADVKVIYHTHNQGKGAALNTGLKHVSGDILIIQDADLEYDPADYPKLIEPIARGFADVVFGSRFMSSDYHRVLYFWHSVGNKCLTLLSNMFTNLNLTDMEVCYKALGRRVYQNLHIEEKRFGVEPEITAKVARMRAAIYEVGVSYKGRTYEQGKKITWKDGVAAVWCILKYNLWHRSTQVLPEKQPETSGYKRSIANPDIRIVQNVHERT